MNHIEIAAFRKLHNKVFWEAIKGNVNGSFLGAFAKLWKATISFVLYAEYNQQDAAYYNILYCFQSSTYFGRFPCPSSGDQKLYIQHLVFVKLCCC
jgi:hypothetical protein